MEQSRDLQPDKVHGETGRPKYNINEDTLEELISLDLPVPCIAKMLGVSRSTLFRRMKEFQLSARNYSDISDEQLDDVVQAIKTEMPTAGYRMVRGRLRSAAATMHRVDSLGILSRLSGLGCIIRRTYSVRGPLSLWHVDTNHKLIRSVRVLLV